jgi:hypothetical protein
MERGLNETGRVSISAPRTGTIFSSLGLSNQTLWRRIEKGAENLLNEVDETVNYSAR